ncbi:MAG TPA: substrate-binding domain-containing protein, partial [Mycobacteriales bacterium]
QPPPDVWVPSSSAWLRLAQTSQPGLFPLSGTSLARSPVVVAMPQPQAQSLGWPSTPLGWVELATGAAQHRIPRFSVPSPLTDTVGMLTVLAANAAMRRAEPDPGIAAMRTLTLRSRLSDTEANLSGLLRQMAGEPDATAATRDVGAFPLTEQQLWTYNRDGHRAPLVGIYPRDATVEADYPLVVSSVVATDERHATLATRLTDWFRTDAAAQALTAHGFRRAGGGGPAPDGLGLADNYPTPTPLPADPKTVLTEVNGWAGYKPLALQVLVLVDGSGSMNSPVRDKAGRTTTKASLLRDAGVQAGQLFGDETSVGLWEFSTHRPGTPYQEVVPYGPIDGSLGAATRRAVMEAAAGHFQAFPGSGTPMYETVLRATAAMRDRYRSGAFSMVVVLTDGHDESSPYHMDTKTFLSRLSKVEDRGRPVPIFAVGYGADADMAALTTMARATGGQAISSVDPSDLATAIARIFLAVHQQR